MRRDLRGAWHRMGSRGSLPVARVPVIDDHRCDRERVHFFGDPTLPMSFNQSVIEEFRANGGKVGGPFEGGDLLLLTTTGAKSGEEHTVALGYVLVEVHTSTGWDGN
jgi:hypothetical protein